MFAVLHSHHLEGPLLELLVPEREAVTVPPQSPKPVAALVHKQKEAAVGGIPPKRPRKSPKNPEISDDWETERSYLTMEAR